MNLTSEIRNTRAKLERLEKQFKDACKHQVVKVYLSSYTSSRTCLICGEKVSEAYVMDLVNEYQSEL